MWQLRQFPAAWFAEFDELRYDEAAGRFTCRLEDGSTGYFMANNYDCWEAAIMTVLQTVDVPLLGREERHRAGEALEVVERDCRAQRHEWASECGLEMVEHAEPPVGLDRWVGVCEFRRRTTTAHYVAMVGAQMFEPVALQLVILQRHFGKQTHPTPRVVSGVSFKEIEVSG